MSIPAMMKAVVLHDADDMRLESRPVPQPGPGEVLLKVNVASICGTEPFDRRRLVHEAMIHVPERAQLVEAAVLQIPPVMAPLLNLGRRHRYRRQIGRSPKPTRLLPPPRV